MKSNIQGPEQYYVLYHKDKDDLVRHTSGSPVIFKSPKEAEKDKLYLKTDKIITIDDYNSGNIPLD